MEAVEGAISAKKELNRWKPRQFSYFTMGFSVLAIVSLGAWVVAMMLGNPDFEDVKDLFKFIEPVEEFLRAWALPAAVAFVIAAVAAELISRFRVPPVQWRVKQELVRALGDMGLLDLEHKDRWRGVLWVAPIGKWDKKTKSFSILFDIRTVKAKERIFTELSESIAGFRGSQDASIEPWKTNNGKRFCMKLTLWYGLNPYESKLEEMIPW